MTGTILPQINYPPQYLTTLVNQLIYPNLINAQVLASNTQADYAEWQGMYNLMVTNIHHYWSNGASYTWDYNFDFSWEIPVDTSDKRRDLAEVIRRQGSGSCPIISGVSGQSTGASATATSAPNTVCTGNWSFVATVFPSSLQSIAGTGTQRYCTCGRW